MTETADPPLAPADEKPAAGNLFEIRVFRALWVAGLVSNLGTFMHIVGASWLLTTLTTSPAIVALLQTATSLPSFLLALPAGAFADVFDRRRLLVLTQMSMAIITLALGVATLVDIVTPTSLLIFSVILSVAATINMPNWVALTPELVRRDQLPAAGALNAVSMNIAQTVGPALGGLVIAAAGPGWVFLLNAASFAGVIVVVIRWKRPTSDTRLPAEHVVSAMRIGLRYVGNEPNIQVVLIRIGAITVFSSALTALMPVIARSRVGASSGEFGLLSGALGAGAVTAAILLPKVRDRTGPDLLVGGGTVGLGFALIASDHVQSITPFAAVLFLAGFGQLLAFTTVFAIAQAILPSWVRGRGLAVAMLVVQGTTALMAAVWGTLAANELQGTMTIAGIGLLITTVVVAPLRLAGRAEIDLTPFPWGEPHTSLDLDENQGPVMITVHWRVDPDRVDAFAEAMTVVRRQRRRDGALSWGLYEDVNRPGHLTESFIVASWAEHERQHQRPVAADQIAQQPARRFLIDNDHDPIVKHQVARSPRRPRRLIATSSKT